MCSTSLLLLSFSTLLGLSNQDSNQEFCSIPDAEPGLKYDGDSAAHAVMVGYSAPFVCYDIYEESRTRLTCLSAYQWSDPSPPCKPITCPTPDAVINGKTETTGWRVGNTAFFSCYEGFWYSGDNPRTCQRNRTWSGRDGRCKEVSCPPPESPHKGTLTPGPPYKYKSQLKVECQQGFVYNGSKVLVCLKHNTWHGTLGQCLDIQQIRCQALKVVGNVTLIPFRKEHNLRETIQISCPEGYTYNGTTRRTCQVDGSWSGHEGKCNVITCPPYIPVGVGWSEPACSPCEYRDTVRVVCPQGYIYNGTELTCDEYGNWTGVKKECKAIPCYNLVVAGGSVVGVSFVYKDEANVRCDPGYTWVGDYPQALCDSYGQWVIQGNCSVLVDLQSASTSSADNNKSTIAAIVCVPLVLLVLVIIGSVFIYKRVFLKRLRGQRSEEDTEQGIPLIDQVFRAPILRDGHVRNRDLDTRIDLDTQFIKLRLVSGEDALKKNDIVPDRYQDYLQKTGGQNIEIEDLLQYVDTRTVTCANCYLKNEIISQNEGSDSWVPHEDVAVKQKPPLLLEGRGGVGKSTLVQKLMRLWAQNKWATDYKAAFLFNIRSLTVVDKRQVSLVDFFKRFGVYVLRDNSDDFILSTLRKDEDKVIIFMDGLDEFSGLAEELGNNRKKQILKLSEPLTWCLNILQRDVLSDSVLILASRHFKDLSAVHCDPVLEVVGLTHEAILQFIDCHVGQECESEEEKTATKKRVKKAMTGNKLVMSVSAITYFCMLFCQVLEEDENVAIEELTSFTRIAAFFFQNYLSRNHGLRSKNVKPTTFMPQLLRLSYYGLVENRVCDNISRLVFDKDDLDNVHLTDEQVSVVGDCGILLERASHQVTDDQSVAALNTTYEFVHLSIQELLAMMELCQKDTYTLKKTAEMMWRSYSFNMAMLYLYGLHFDTQSENINMLMQMLPVKKDEQEDDQRIKKTMLLDILAKTGVKVSEDLLQVLQVTYETQNEGVVKEVAANLFKASNEMELSETLLTAIDMNAIIFMLKHAGNINKLRLTDVTMDEICVGLLSSYLKVDAHLEEVAMKGTAMTRTSLETILEGFGYQPQQKSLDLANTGMDVDGAHIVLNAMSTVEGHSLANTGMDVDGAHIVLNAMSTVEGHRLETLGVDNHSVQVVADALSTNTSLTSIQLYGQWRGDSTLETVMEKLFPNTTLQLMRLTDHDKNTSTLVCVPGTGRRINVWATKKDTSIYAWTHADITSTGLFSHDGVVWGGGKIRVYLDGQFSSIYGKNPPLEITEVRSQLMNDITDSEYKDRVKKLQIVLSSGIETIRTSQYLP